MKPHEFNALLAQLKELNLSQILEATKNLDEVRRASEALAVVEERAAAIQRCPKCGAQKVSKWGMARTGTQRFRCASCQKTFTGRTETKIARLHKVGLFLEVVRDMLDDRTPAPIRHLATRFGLNKHTVWRWRHLVFEAFKQASDDQFSGIVEVDETFQKESRKGSREWVNHERNPQLFPKPPRLRWYEYGKQNQQQLRGLSRWQVPILTITDRTDRRRLERIRNKKHATIEAALVPHLDPDVVLCTDGNTAYQRISSKHGYEHHRILAKPNAKTKSKVFHIQNINNIHSHFKYFMKPFRGPSSKYLTGYANWFVARTKDFPVKQAFIDG